MLSAASLAPEFEPWYVSTDGVMRNKTRKTEGEERWEREGTMGWLQFDVLPITTARIEWKSSVQFFSAGMTSVLKYFDSFIS